ncbi:MAG: uroporphyrinogen decarboxylase family protein [Armatimonadota bacterium]
MTSRERVRRAIEFNNPDRVPVQHGVLPAAYYTHGEALVQLLSEFPDDFGYKPAIPAQETLPGPYRQGRHTDEWGCVWENERDGILGICIGHPLEDWTNWSSYKLPDTLSQEYLDNVQRNLSAPEGHENYVLGFGTNIFERMQWLRGYETLMYDLAMDAPEAYVLRDALVEWAVENAKMATKTDIDGMSYSDDWGTQVALIISPDKWRKFFRPAYRKMFEPGKLAGKHIHFHTDGFTWEILHDLVEVGVDVLNVQHTIMDIRAIAREFGGKVAFRSDLDRQHILPHGNRQQIRNHVKEVIDCLGSYGGGLIGHGEVGPDVPLENVRAMLEAWFEFGTY